MAQPDASATTRLRTDDGFTLVEVIVALALMSLVASAALYFFLSGTRTITHQQRTQNAVVVANDAMEAAYGVVAQPVDDVSGLLVGRSEAAVTAGWSTGTTLGVEGMAATYPAWDPAGTGQGTLPVSQERSLNGVDYQVLTLVGHCYRPISNTAAACSTVPGNLTDPATVPAGYAQMLRVMVHVSWDSVQSPCGDTACSYQVASLVDPNSDLEWNNTTRPIAVDDVAVVEVGQAVTVDVVRNDVIGFVVTNPVRNVTVTGGTGTATLQADGQVRFQAPTNASGIMTFTYMLKDAAGRESNTATVRVSVMPRAVDDTATTNRATPVTIPVTTNDQGTPASVQIITQPAFGRATPSGTGVVFDPQGGVGSPWFEYQFTDTSGLVSTTARVRLTVTTYANPIALDLTVGIAATQAGSTAPIDWVTLTGNPSGYQIEVMSSDITQGKLKINGNDYNATTNRRGTQLAYAQQGNVPGYWTVQYRVWTPDGSVSSEIKTMRIILVPTPANDSVNVTSGTTNNSINVGSNDAPNNFGGTVQFRPTSTSTLASNCGTLPTTQPDLNNGIFRYNAPTLPNGTNSRTCTFTYVIQGTGQYTNLVSTPATVTIRVGR
ncbi:Ig-like domain-containing protein [Cellulomonas oligotrophica]|uniref:Prepilin-type N-terminal cleavage/methylation domain-containing protein n=1 Tax=Cellulomonas oligotrophica TaxID=931536 RepID=A0A7Y9FC98_9CELL|nr:Ig-like domain-containing protein [Cellulomonas oligotrophica]NYD84686.1 prepilin-type N-terminal cleavage/methylation domain-containing protein [Cellulomonas oligotrophica]GIG31753.1 hypothetical protein Col01nite_09120 [Cellulomonas oligotrophica]